MAYANDGERVAAESWQEHEDHVARYRYAQPRVRSGERVHDIACGVGYGATFLTHAAYHGYDKPGVPRPDLFPGTFYGVDLEDRAWRPPAADVTVCFETIEHVTDPVHLAAVIGETSRRAVILSVPTYPHQENPFHLTTFSLEEVPLLFPEFAVAEEWPQPEGRSHTWVFYRKEDSA